MDQSGNSRRDLLEQVQNQTGKVPKELDGPKFPYLLSHLWSAFLDLDRGRSSGMSSANPISYQEIKSWMDITHTPLSPRDIDAIKRLDITYLGAINES